MKPLWILAAALTVVIVGCSTPREEDARIVGDADPSALRHEVVLYVSNQNRQTDPVDIRVTVDGKRVVNGKFELGSGHNWSTFKLSLQGGTHHIIANSEKGGASLDVVFEVHRKRWLTLDYWGRGRFQLGIWDKEVFFL